jgi:hypothetical protein
MSWTPLIRKPISRTENKKPMKKHFLIMCLSLIATGQALSQIQPINLSPANGGTGDNLRAGGIKINANFQYLDGLIDDNAERIDSLIDAGVSASWASITGKPTTIAGFGITDGVTLTGSQTLTNKTLTSPVINTPTGIVKGDVGLGNVDNTSDANKPVSTATQTALNLKANLASPTFTGTPAAPTASAATSTTQIATTAFTHSLIVPVSSSGTAIAFDVPRTYGYSADETGNITLNSTGLREGVTQLIIHNHSVEPTFGAEFTVIGGTYTTGVDNYILCHAVKSNLILVTISQAQ